MSIGAVLFAAGAGTRLRPLTQAVPKAAVPLLDVPLGTFALEALLAARPPVVVNVSHMASRARAALGARAPAGAVEFFVEEPGPLGTAGTLRALRERLARTVLTWNADALSDLDPGALLEHHERLGAPATVAVRHVGEGADFRTRDEGIAALIDRRSRPREAGLLFLGVAVFEREALSLLRDGPPIGLTEALLGPLIARDDVAAYEHGGYALDVGTVPRYLEASLDLLEGRGPQPGRAWPGERRSVPGGWTYLGPGASAPEETLGPGAVVLAGAAVEPGARVERSVVWPGARVPAGAHLDDAVYGV